MDVLARTDRTHACEACGVRSWPASRCPRCRQTRTLVALRGAPLVAGRPLVEGPLVRSWRRRAHVVGLARPAEAFLTAPLSRRACLAWVIAAELPSGLFLDAVGSRFEVVAERTTMLVEGARGGYDLSASPDPWEGVCPERLSESLRAFFRDRGVQRASLVGTTLHERVLTPGARVEASGFPVELVRTEASYRGSGATSLLTDEPGAPLRVSWIAPH